MRKEMNNLNDQLSYLQMKWLESNYKEIISQAAKEGWDHLECFNKLIEGQVNQRMGNGTNKRIKQACFPVIKTLDQFDWSWPRKINELQVKHLFRLHFLEKKTNVVFVGPVGVGKSHLATALGYAACCKGISVLFVSATDMITTLSAAQAINQIDDIIKKYTKPSLLILDELGFTAIDKHGCDVFFQIVVQRYEKGSTIITTNRAFKDWHEIFNNDNTITSAILDRILHHVEPVVIEGKSYRMKDSIQE